jgi:hypothetical protein
MKEQGPSHVENDTPQMKDLNPIRHAWFGKPDSTYSVAVSCEAHVLAKKELRVLDR